MSIDGSQFRHFGDTLHHIMSLLEEIGMRNRVHNSAIYFRANNAVIAALRNGAEKSGCSVSEYMRAIVRDRVGIQ